MEYKDCGYGITFRGTREQVLSATEMIRRLQEAETEFWRRLWAEQLQHMGLTETATTEME